MILALLPLGAAISSSGDQMLQPLAIAIIAGIMVQLPLVLLAMPAVIGLTVHEWALLRRFRSADALQVVGPAGFEPATPPL
jgi:Cu/Ag efflux pump CusA